MRVFAFLYSVLLLALGGTALVFRGHPGSGEFAYSAFFFGGSVLICALFSISMPRHGLSAAAFLAFLAFLTGCGKIFTELTTSPTPAAAGFPPVFTGVLTVLSLLYMAISIRAWRRSRHLGSGSS